MKNTLIPYMGYIKMLLKPIAFFTLILVNSLLIGCDVLAQSSKPIAEADYSTIHVQESHQDYTLDISYPITQLPQIDAVLSDFMTTRLIRFKDDLLESTPEETKASDNIYVLHARIAYSSKDVLSFRISESVRVGQGESLEIVHTFNFNKSTEEDISIDNLFPHQDQYLKVLSELSYAKIAKDPRFSKVPLSHIQEGTLPFMQNYSCFLYDDKGLTLLFNSGQVAPESFGTLALFLPFTLLDEHLDLNVKAFTEGYKALYPIFPISSGTYAEDESAYFNKLPESNPSTTATPLKPIALTFDDGPHPQYTNQILQILANHNAKATFFVIGKRARAFPDIAKSIAEEGHALGNHTWSHPQLIKLDRQHVMAQIDMTQRTIERITGRAPTSVRVPYGRFTKEVHEWINMPLIQWSVDPEDWKTKDAALIVNRVLEHTKPGSIILLHDIQSATVEALPLILEHLISKGYTFVTIDDLLALDKHEVYYKKTIPNEK